MYVCFFFSFYIQIVCHCAMLLRRKWKAWLESEAASHKQACFFLLYWFIKKSMHYFSFLHLHEIVEGLYFHCSLSVCLCVCVSVCVRNSCEQNSSRTDAPIWTQFSLNGCLQHWLGPYWNWWPWVKGQGHGDWKYM